MNLPNNNNNYSNTNFRKVLSDIDEPQNCCLTALLIIDHRRNTEGTRILFFLYGPLTSTPLRPCSFTGKVFLVRSFLRDLTADYYMVSGRIRSNVFVSRDSGSFDKSEVLSPLHFKNDIFHCHLGNLTILYSLQSPSSLLLYIYIYSGHKVNMGQR